MNALVHFRAVSKVFGNDVALSDINLEIPRGQITALIGPSGCGKSTILRMIAGLEEISAGDIYIGDRRVNDVPPKDRDIAMVFQNYALYPHMSVYNNMAYGLRNRGMPKSEIDTRVQEAARIPELGSMLDRSSASLLMPSKRDVA